MSGGKAYRRVGVSAFSRGVLSAFCSGVGSSGILGIPPRLQERRVGGSACQRIDVFVRRWVGPRFNYPTVGAVDHFNDLSQDLVASVIKFVEDFLLKIALSKSNLDMDLGLSGFGLRVIKLRNKAAWYRLFLQASAKFAHTEREDRLTWSVSVYLSSIGKCLVSSKIRITSDVAP
jgi:hypothetical protein